ncbi:MAG: hypothetical protein DYG93_07580 [Leptolyngbya sp. PLA2]|nr:hypothetical protein [Leptolyngbya sp.]MCE7971508.1 hypothetical protein [Leptolyngbya sp. PL-A2]MCZ7632280.1 hypothetical protein [Phycisphaerales bacterium]MDL1903692.1 hypothetical protein [Synechococcales cyanobacterium CNB]GIK18445.1 MAG: hypothetical protein BroJett004_06090 [Planctomycetota bacterium]
MTGRNARHARRFGHRSRGITFLEVVLSTVILAMAVSAMASACGFLFSVQTRQQRTLGCAEVANRLILQYLDDQKSLPNPDLPVEYGPAQYRWRLEKSRVRVVTDPALDQAVRDRRMQSGLSLDRLEQITVTVWLSERSGGARTLAEGPPSVTMTRLTDPVKVYRNPDSFSNLINTEEGRRSLINMLMGGSQ